MNIGNLRRDLQIVHINCSGQGSEDASPGTYLKYVAVKLTKSRFGRFLHETCMPYQRYGQSEANTAMSNFRYYLRPRISRASSGVATSLPYSSITLFALSTNCALLSASTPLEYMTLSSIPTRTFPPIATAA